MSPNASTGVLVPRNRVVQVRRFGGPDGLEVVDAPLPTAGRGELRIHVLASRLEYTDVTIRRRLYPQTAARAFPPYGGPRMSPSSLRSRSALGAEHCHLGADFSHILPIPVVHVSLRSG
jgi:hypothetical protein